MTAALAGVLQALTVVAVLVVVHRPLGDHMARVWSSPRDLRVERAFYRLVGVDPTS